MLKKLGCAISILAVLAIFSLQSFASSVNDIIYDKKTKSTDEFLVTITRPEGDESTFKTSYVICGNTENKDIMVEILILNEKGDYEAFENTDGESSWDIGESGVFMKEVVLPNLDANQIRIAAYKKAEIDNAKLNENLQIRDFTITVLKEEVKDKIKNGFVSVTDILKDIFK